MSVAEYAFLVVQPSSLIAVVLGLGLVGLLLGAGWARAALGLGAGLYLVCGVLPAGPALIASIEARVPFEGYAGAPPDGIIVLGGYVDPAASVAKQRIVLNARAERITEAAALARRYPDARIVLTDGERAADGKAGAELSRALLNSIGIDDARIIVEPRSSSTHENATFSHALVAPEPGQRWILVTSAFHMPRSLATFRTAGWSGLIPWPVDPIDDGRPVWRQVPWSPAQGLRMLDIAVRELTATLYYRAMGYTDPSASSADAAERRIGPRTASGSTG